MMKKRDLDQLLIPGNCLAPTATSFWVTRRSRTNEAGSVLYVSVEALKPSGKLFLCLHIDPLTVSVRCGPH
jgi:hypothetical protein